MEENELQESDELIDEPRVPHSNVGVYIAFIAIMVTLAVAIGILVYLPRGVSFFGTGGDTIQTGEETLRDSMSSETAALPVERTLTGMVMLYDPAQSFIKLAVRGESAYSVGIDSETKITKGGALVTATDLGIGIEVSIFAREVPDTELYDFMAKTIGINGGGPDKELTIEERTERLLERGAIQSF